MLFGPIFAADVVTSARRTRYYWLRVIYAILVLMVMALCYVPGWTAGESTIQSTANLAAAFFSSFAYLQITAVVLMGPAFTAGAIAVERERRTIEYLFATDLSNVEIVYGKFAAALLRIFVLLLVSIPILAIARLLGGIAYDRMLAVFAVTASTAVAVVALSLTISVWCPRAREAVIRTYMCLFGLIVLPLIVVVLLQALFAIAGRSGLGWMEYPLWPLYYVMQILSAANPYWAITGIISQDLRGVTTNSGSWTFVGILVGEHAVLVALCAVLAPWAVRRVHLKAVSKAAKREDSIFTKTLEDGVTPAPTARRRLFRRSRRRVSENSPMLWKELVAERAQSRLGWIGRIVVAIALLLILGTTLFTFGAFVWSGLTNSGGMSGAAEAFQGFAAVIATLVTCGALLMVAARGATSITSERERDTWNALLATPLEPSEIVLAKFWGALYAGRWVVPLLGFLWLLCGIAAPRFLVGLPFIVGTIAILACFFTALGVIFSLHCSNSTRSLGATLAVCIVLGGGYYLCCGCMLAPLAVSGGNFNGVDEFIAFLMFSPWPPFLTFAPYYLGTVLEENSGGGEVAELVLAYVVGNVGYFAGAITLLSATIAGFNRAVGRRDAGDSNPQQFVFASTLTAPLITPGTDVPGSEVVRGAPDVSPGS